MKAEKKLSPDERQAVKDTVRIVRGQLETVRYAFVRNDARMTFDTLKSIDDALDALFRKVDR